MNFWKQLNLPNKLTVLRMVMVPVLWIVYLCIPADWLLMSKEAGFGLRNLLALLLFCGRLDYRSARWQNSPFASSDYLVWQVP